MRRVALALPASVASPAAQQVPMEVAERARRERELPDLKHRIGAIGTRLSAAPATSPPLPAPAVAVAEATADPSAPLEPWRAPILGNHQPGKGFELANGDNGALTFSGWSYVHYLNQLGLEETYTDAFGRTFDVSRRHDLQLNKVALTFRGWLLDERPRDLWFVRTQNTSAGEGGRGLVFTTDFLLAL